MKKLTRQKLMEAQNYCDNNDKSTEFMLQYMQDYAGVDLDCVINFIQELKSNTIDNNEPYVEVFVTKNNKLRAYISNNLGLSYEVTIGGKEWRKGKGKEHIHIIKKKCSNLLNKLTDIYNNNLCKEIHENQC